jgi:hypothetical protein
MGYDGQGAISAITSNNNIMKLSWKYFYIIKSIRRIIQQSNIQWKLCHLKGHQGDHDPFDVPCIL